MKTPCLFKKSASIGFQTNGFKSHTTMLAGMHFLPEPFEPKKTHCFMKHMILPKPRADQNLGVVN